MNQISQLLRFTRDVRAEVSRIYWPTRAETQKLTLMVVILATLISVYLSVVDMALGAGLSALFGLSF